jgi:hypothetical protein
MRSGWRTNLVEGHCNVGSARAAPEWSGDDRVKLGFCSEIFFKF